MNGPRVSVVIPTFNSGALTVEAVQSVLAQTTPAHEIIVVDDGSTDDTTARLAAFGSVLRYFRQENQGVSSARNRGVAAATGDWVGFLDADDVWHPRKLELQLAALDSRPQVGLLGSRIYGWPGEGQPEPDPRSVVAEVPLDQLVVRNAFVTSTVLVRSELLRQAGEFDRSLHGPEDHDLWLRIARLSRVANLEQRLAGYRAVEGSLSKNAVRMEAGMRAILRKLEAADVFHRRPLLRRRAWAYFRYSCGYMHHRAGHRGPAVAHLALSVLGYPFPYSRADVRYPLGRVRLLTAVLLQLGRELRFQFPADSSGARP